MLNCVSHMADVAQLVRASVCGTECRRFESGHPPHKKLNTPTAWFIFYLDGSGSNRRNSRFEILNQGERECAGLRKQMGQYW